MRSSSCRHWPPAAANHARARRVRARLLAWTLALTALGCEARWPEGSLHCEADEACPSGWVCGPDQRCYSKLEQSSDDAVPTRDAAPSDASSAKPDAEPEPLEPTKPAPGGKDAGASGISKPDSGATEPMDGAVSEPDASLDAGPEAGPDAQTPSAPSLGGPCDVPGERTCAGHAQVDKLFCADGQWIHNGTCDGSDRCDTRSGEMHGTCQPIHAACLGKSPGDAVCVSGLRWRCNPDLIALEEHGCGENSHCEADSAGAVRCVCDAGHADDGQGRCVNVDDCSPGVCGHGVCQDGLDAYTCQCDAGFMSNGETCVNIPDCPNPDPCAPFGTCVDGVSSFSCSCVTGYVMSGTTCVRRDDCPSPEEQCPGGICIPQPGGFVCDCAGLCEFYVEGACYPDPCCPSGCGGF